MNLKDKKKCDDCKSNVIKYCDGYILKDWSGNDADIAENSSVGTGFGEVLDLSRVQEECQGIEVFKLSR